VLPKRRQVGRGDPLVKTLGRQSICHVYAAIERGRSQPKASGEVGDQGRGLRMVEGARVVGEPRPPRRIVVEMRDRCA